MEPSVDSSSAPQPPHRKTVRSVPPSAVPSSRTRKDSGGKELPQWAHFICWLATSKVTLPLQFSHRKAMGLPSFLRGAGGPAPVCVLFRRDHAAASPAWARALYQARAARAMSLSPSG